MEESSCDACLLFNILHGESPVELLEEARRIVRPGGVLAIIHWRSDIVTPRGPPLNIRPTAQMIEAWAATAGGLTMPEPAFILPQWHYGLRFTRVRLLAS